MISDLINTYENGVSHREADKMFYSAVGGFKNGLRAWYYSVSDRVLEGSLKVKGLLKHLGRKK